MTETFLAESPASPMADEAGLALVANAFELGDHAGMIRIAEQFARVHPASPLRDRFAYSAALGYFHLGQLDRAIALAREIVGQGARPDGALPEAQAMASQAIALLGRIHEARLEPAEALSYYRRIAGRVADAAEAVEALTAKSLRVPEISVVRPEDRGAKPARARGRGAGPHPSAPRRDVPQPRRAGRAASIPSTCSGSSRDVMTWAPSRRSTWPASGRSTRRRSRWATARASTWPSAFAGSTSRSMAKRLPGHAPRRRPVRLGTGRAHADGAGGYAVIRDRRIRIAVATPAPAAAWPVQVKVIGSRSPGVQLGETDLRGVFVADAADGRITVVARRGAAGYAIVPVARRG